MKASTKISTRKINSALNLPTETAREKLNQTCLHNAVSRESELNYQAIMEGFSKHGINETAIIPRVNVFTKYAWEALGYVVLASEKYNGVTVKTLRFFTDKTDGQRKSYLKSTKVWHIAQVARKAG